MSDFTKFKSIKLESDNLYEIGVYNYNSDIKIPLFNFVLDYRHEMNYRLISNELYNSPDELITIMDMNNIINPYSFYKGQTIVITTKEFLDLLKNNKEELNNIKNALIDSKKTKRIDTAKLAFNNNLNRNILEENKISYLKNKPEIKKENNIIKIGPGF